MEGLCQRNKGLTVHYPHIVNQEYSHNISNIMSINSVISICRIGPQKLKNDDEVLGIEVSQPESHPPGRPIPSLGRTNDLPIHPSQHATHPMEDYVVGSTRQRKLREILTLLGIIAVTQHVEAGIIPQGLRQLAPWTLLSRLHRTDPINWMLILSALAFDLSADYYIVGNRNGFQGLFILINDPNRTMVTMYPVASIRLIFHE
jgi:hypothetical protein